MPYIYALREHIFLNGRLQEGLSNDYINAPPTNSSEGIWRDVHTASVYSSIHKDTTGHQVVMKMQPIGKEIYFNISTTKRFSLGK